MGTTGKERGKGIRENRQQLRRQGYATLAFSLGIGHKYMARPVSLMSYNPQSDYQSFSKRCPEIGDEVKPAQMYS